jgi:hypothetical protein
MQELYCGSCVPLLLLLFLSSSAPAGSESGITVSGVARAGNALYVAALQGPGMSGSNMWLLPDPTAAAANPEGHAWPLALAVVAGSSGSSSRGGSSSNSTASAGGHSRQVAVKAAVAASLGAAVVVGLLLAAWCCWYSRRKRRLTQQQQQQQQQHVKGLILGVHGPSRHRSTSTEGRGGGCHKQQLKQVQAAAVLPAVMAGTSRVWDVENPTPDQRHSQQPRPPMQQVHEHGSRGCASLAGAACSGNGKRSSVHGGSVGLNSSSAAGPANAAAGPPAAAVPDAGDGVSASVAAGLQAWQAAISSTTLTMMERRLQQCLLPGQPSRQPWASHTPAASLLPAAAAAAAGLPCSAAGSCSGSEEAGSGQVQQALQLSQLLGQGSFGSVYLGTW